MELIGDLYDYFDGVVGIGEGENGSEEMKTRSTHYSCEVFLRKEMVPKLEGNKGSREVVFVLR